MSLIVPSVFIVVIAVAAARKVNVFSSFCAGAESGIKFALSLLPTLAAVFMMCALFDSSGLSDALARALSPAMRALGIPEELSKLVLIKPFSGSGSLSLLTETIQKYGPDSYAARCACTIYASSETVFYIFALYFAGTNRRGRALPLAMVVAATALSSVLACLLCRVM